MSDADVLAMLRRKSEEFSTPQLPVRTVLDRRFGPISRVAGTNAGFVLRGAGGVSHSDRAEDAGTVRGPDTEPVGGLAPRPSTSGLCGNCGRSGEVDLAVPHFARSDSELADMSAERGGKWRAAMCFPRNGMLIRLSDYSPKDARHEHHLGCGIQTTKTTYRSQASG